MWRRLGIVSLAFALLSGCWLQPDFDARHSRSNDLETRLTIDNVDTLHQIWSTWTGRTGAASPRSMVAGGGSVYVGTIEAEPAPGGGIQPGASALDAATGRVRWNWNPPFGTIGGVGQTPISLVGDEVYSPWEIGGGGAGCLGRFDRLDARTGQVVGTQDTHVYDIVQGDGHVVLTNTSSNCFRDTLRVSVRDAGSTQTRFWVNVSRDAADNNKAVIAGGMVFVVADHRLYAIDPAGCGSSSTCAPAWSVALGLDGDTAPVASADGSRVFVATDGNEVLAIDTGTRAVVWRAPGASGFDNTMALSGDMLLVRAPTDHALLAYDAEGCGQAECEPLWSTRPGAAQRPTVAGSVVYVGAPLELQGYEIEAYDLAGCPSSPCDPVATLPLSDTGSVSNVREIVVAEGRLLVAHGPVTAFAPG